MNARPVQPVLPRLTPLLCAKTLNPEARCRYGALKSLGERKACFNEYLQLRKKEEKEEARQRCAPHGLYA